MTADAIIFDMDGTLCDVSAIEYLLDKERNNGKRDFDKFHTLSEFEPPVEWVAESARNVIGAHVLIVSAREDRFRDLTRRWLKRHDICYSGIFMRKTKDYRPDYEVKADILSEITQVRGYRPVLAYDDNPNVIRLWRDCSIPVIQVPRDWT